MTNINHEIASELTDHLRHGTTAMSDTEFRVPIAHFISDERAQAERELMKRLPLIVGHCSEIADPGSFITREILGIPLIVVRRSDGAVESYVNICRHRGGRVENEALGKKRFFKCQYHGWTYASDGGELRGVPYDEFYTHVDRPCHGLRTVKTEERYGFLWADFSNDPGRTIGDYLGPGVDAQLAPFDLARSVIFLDRSFTLDINWKLILDGAIDVLHPKFLHPGGVGKLIESNTSAWREYGRHGQSFSPRTRMGEMARSGEPIEAAWRMMASNLFIYPNASVIVAPDHVEFWTVWPSPDHPGRSTTQIRFLVNPEILDERIEQRLNRSWAILEEAASQEDWPMEATIQNNARAWPEGTFLYGRNEQACQHLHRQLARDLDGIEG